MEKEKDQLIQEYLDNMLLPDERSTFEKRLKSDIELAEEVQALRDVEMDLKAAGHESFKAEVKQWEQGYQKSHHQRRFYSLIAIAASLVVVFLTGYFYMNQQPGTTEKLYAMYFVPYEDMILTRGELSESESQLANGMSAYNDGNYTLAAEMLGQYRINNTSDKAAALYLAISETELGRFTTAERNFKLAIEDVKFQQQSQWYLSLMYIKSKQTDNAVSQLQLIVANANHYKTKEALQLLDEIRD